MSKIVNDLEDRFIQSKRKAVEDMLSTCSAEQIALFNRLFSVTEAGAIPVTKLDTALDLLERTIKKNAAGRRTL